MPAFAQDPIGLLTRAVNASGDLFTLGRVFGRDVFVVSHPTDLRYVLLENHANFIKGDALDPLRLVVGDGLVVTDGPKWRRTRRLVQPTFHRRRVGQLVEQMAAVAAAGHRRWLEDTDPELFDVSSAMMDLTQRVLLTTMIGIRDEVELRRLSRAWDVVVTEVTRRLTFPLQLPLWAPTARNRRFRGALAELDGAAYAAIERSRGGGENNLVTTLLEARDDDGAEGLDARALRDEIMTVFSGGFETTAVTLAWLWNLLAEHPEVEARLHEEVDTVLERGAWPSLEQLSQLTYTRMVIEETMRLYPGAWVFTRTNVEADVVGGHRIRPNSILFIAPYLTHRLAEFWSEPERFDPERFDPERSRARAHFEFLPFGGGPRTCVGRTLAMTEMQVIVSMTARRFRMAAIEGRTVEPEGTFTLRSRPNLIMKLQPRRASKPSP